MRGDREKHDEQLLRGRRGTLTGLSSPRQDEGTLVQAGPRFLLHHPLTGLSFPIANSLAPLGHPPKN